MVSMVFMLLASEVFCSDFVPVNHALYGHDDLTQGRSEVGGRTRVPARWSETDTPLTLPAREVGR